MGSFPWKIYRHRNLIHTTKINTIDEHVQFYSVFFLAKKKIEKLMNEEHGDFCFVGVVGKLRMRNTETSVS